jgi:hypothetical protein
MIKLRSLIKENSGYEFVGFHKQKRERGTPYDDLFVANNEYGKTYFREVLDSLYNKDRDYAIQQGWIEFDWSNTYSDQYDEMEKMVVHWLNDKGYRWIFVTQNRPIGVNAYGNYTYKIFFKISDVLHIFDDPMGADDIAFAYVYHISHPPISEDYVESQL